MTTIDFRAMRIIDKGPARKSFKFRLCQYVKARTIIHLAFS